MRQPKPFKRSQTNSWYVQIDGKQIPLGPDEAEAYKRYYELMAKRPDPADLPESTTAVGLLIRFLKWQKTHSRKARTYEWYARYLKGSGKGKKEFIEYLAGLIGENAPASAVKANHVTKWLDYRGYKDTTRFGAIVAIKRAFNWAVGEDLIAISPIHKMKRGKPKRRETIISPDQWEQIFAAIDETDPFRDAVTFLRETGVRPFELRNVEARHFNRELGVLQLPSEESKGEIARTIYLNETALALVEKLATGGHIFRNSKGRPWGADALLTRFTRLRKKTGIAKLSCYVTRHSFATKALLVNKVDSVLIGQLMGHKDLTMVAKVYGHLNDTERLREHAAKATA